ncbi:sporulation protein YqfC [Clostridium cavendishii DSM 21758]|uniref:Sporulation protein YqfC n=1 Tax=Clostridium cavendishii DSM 21758 TaxID=1121302 RepID=A0A1M6AMB2_9CLOT|nr:sporulation protein YqfC [Clostridium cavendishii]SHI37640.1 sporulation protein YqfC [Clostridium cavendishii DSM 21758]
MEDKLNEVKGIMAEKLELPRDIVMNLPKITITGDSEITIENHKGIICFDKERIKVNTKIGIITIEGKEFEILFIGGSTVTIGGKFEFVDYNREA